MSGPNRGGRLSPTRLSPTWAASGLFAVAAAGLFALSLGVDAEIPAPAETVLTVRPLPPVAVPPPAAPEQPAVTQPTVTQEQDAYAYVAEGESTEEPLPAPAPVPAPAYVGLPPRIADAVPAHPVPGRALVAVVIDDMGLDRKRSARAVRLPGPLTLSWLPYAEDLPAQTAAARAAGHELMLHLPMEPSIPVNPGPDALLTGLDPAEIMRRLDRALGRFPGFVGVNNHMGSRFTVDRAAMRPVLAEIGRRGYFWYDSRTAPATVGMALAAELGVPWAGRDVFLDHVMKAGDVAKALARLEAAAKQTGAATAIGHPHDVTIDALARWLPELPKRGLTLVPLSAVVAAKHPAFPLRQTGEAR